jgi:di/tricarboxylate transporter
MQETTPLEEATSLTPAEVVPGRTVINHHAMLTVFSILAGAVVLFAWGRPRADVVAMLVVLALMLTRVLSPKEALAGFGDPVVILIAAVFIVGEGLVNTGVIQRIGQFVLRAGGRSEARLIVLFMLLAGGIGAFMNSTAIVAMFIPVVLMVCNQTGLNRKRMLMPLSVATLISGMMTLVASTPNMIVEGALRSAGLPTFSFFSWTPFGLAILVASVAYMLAIRPLLTRELRAEDEKTKLPSARDLVSSYGLGDWWHRLRVPASSPLVHRALSQMRPLYDRFGARILAIERHPHGKAEYLAPLPEATLEPDDAVFVVVPPDRAQSLIETQQLLVLPPLEARQRANVLQQFGVAEIMVAPESKLIGKTLGELDLRARHHVAALATRHRGASITTNLPEQRLDFGDTLLISGDWADIARLWEDRQNFLVLTLPAEYQERFPARRRLPIALGILVAMIAVMAFDLLPNSAAALLAALAMMATGCVGVDAIYRVISWQTVVLTAGMLPLATALTKTGATALMGHALVTTLGSLGPTAVLVAVFLVTAVVGLFLSNSATAVLIAPIAIEAAQRLHIPIKAMAMTVSISCCAAFVTPVSSTVNMLVMEPGGYRFGDFVKVGLPLLVLVMVVTLVLVGVIHPT